MRLIYAFQNKLMHIKGRNQYNPMEASREIELEGHIIDSGIMTMVFDRIMDLGGNFEILVFDVGKQKTDPSYARLRVNAATPDLLDSILSELHRFGARQLEIHDVTLVPAEGDRIVPKGFYSTTNHPTRIRCGGEMIDVEDIKMDTLIVVDPEKKKARCTLLAKLKKDDLVVIGEQGVVVDPPDRPREETTFEFMHGTVSPERPSETLIAQIAREIIDVKKSGGKIVLVGGPAIIHTGADNDLSWIIRNGYIDPLLAGNALATHDIENNLFGAALGMDIGGTRIGMHLHPVVVPVHTDLRKIGEATLILAKTRPKFVGGPRAQYNHDEPAHK